MYICFRLRPLVLLRYYLDVAFFLAYCLVELSDPCNHNSLVHEFVPKKFRGHYLFFLVPLPTIACEDTVQGKVHRVRHVRVRILLFPET